MQVVQRVLGLLIFALLVFYVSLAFYTSEAEASEAQLFAEVPLFTPYERIPALRSTQVLVPVKRPFLPLLCYAEFEREMKRSLFEYDLVDRARCLMVHPNGDAVWEVTPITQKVPT